MYWRLFEELKQVWLDRSLVGNIPGCFAGRWHAVPFAGVPLGFSHCVKEGQPCPENPAHLWTVTQPSCNKSMRMTVEGTQWCMYKTMVGMVMEAINIRKATKVGDPV